MDEFWNFDRLLPVICGMADRVSAEGSGSVPFRAGKRAWKRLRRGLKSFGDFLLEVSSDLIFQGLIRGVIWLMVQLWRLLVSLFELLNPWN